MYLNSEEQQTEMTHTPSSDMCEVGLSEVSEMMDLLHIDVETDVVEDRPGRGDALCSVSLSSVYLLN